MNKATDLSRSQCIVVTVDAERIGAEGEPARWEIFRHHERKPTGAEAVQHARGMAYYRVGKIPLASTDPGDTNTGLYQGRAQALGDADSFSSSSSIWRIGSKRAMRTRC